MGRMDGLGGQRVTQEGLGPHPPCRRGRPETRGHVASPHHCELEMCPPSAYCVHSTWHWRTRGDSRGAPPPPRAGAPLRRTEAAGARDASSVYLSRQPGGPRRPRPPRCRRQRRWPFRVPGAGGSERPGPCPRPRGRAEAAAGAPSCGLVPVTFSETLGGEDRCPGEPGQVRAAAGAAGHTAGRAGARPRPPAPLCAGHSRTECRAGLSHTSSEAALPLAFLLGLISARAMA